MNLFVARMQLLGEKLGAILLQFPPTFTLDYLPHLIAFLGQIPASPRYAIEFRDLSWRRGRVFALLRRHNIAWVAADYIHLPPEVHLTADFTYLRFIGVHGQFPEKDRERLDQSERLQMWQRQLEPVLDQLDTVYGFFNNDFSGHSPLTCNRFKQLVGLPTRYPHIPVQRTLF
jgi:uncharacterized protein YecE (DUF72 family)